MKEILVVGIYNTIGRVDEYTPFKDAKHGGGNGEQYSKFIIQELKPFIDKDFRTLSNAENTSICGSSLGGLISLYIVIAHPETFSSAIVVSPSFWWADEKIIPWMLSQKIDETKTKIWIDMGSKEGNEALGSLRKFDKAFKKKYPHFKNYTCKEFPNAQHNEAWWKKRFQFSLQYIFGCE